MPVFVLFVSAGVLFDGASSLWVSLRYLHVCSEVLVLGKQFNKKAKVNFKIYDVTNWITNNYNTHIAQYLKR